ncbi:MAG: hypothetical protein ACXVCP_00755 [Bdellovibrio sp.]
MKNVLILAGVLLSSFAANADVIKCVFTEPFVSTEYSMTRSTLTYHSAMENTDKVEKNVSFQIKEAGVFQLVSKDGQVLQTLTLNHQGSDGMSETVYPYEAKSEFGIGGCTSNQLPAKKVD